MDAIIGVTVARYVLAEALGNNAIRYAVTVPVAYRAIVAFVAELAISFFLYLNPVILLTDSSCDS